MQEIIADWNELTIVGKAFVVLGPVILAFILARKDMGRESRQ